MLNFLIFLNFLFVPIISSNLFAYSSTEKNFDLFFVSEIEIEESFSEIFDVDESGNISNPNIVLKNCLNQFIFKNAIYEYNFSTLKNIILTFSDTSPPFYS